MSCSSACRLGYGSCVPCFLHQHPPYGEGMRNEAVSMAESWLFSTTRMDSTTPRNLNTGVPMSQLHNSNSLTCSSIHSSLISSGELDCVATVKNQGLWEGQELHWGWCWWCNKQMNNSTSFSSWNPSRPAWSPLYAILTNEPLKTGPFLYLKSTCPCHYFQWGTNEQSYLDSDRDLRQPLGLLAWIPLCLLSMFLGRSHPNPC